LPVFKLSILFAGLVCSAALAGDNLSLDDLYSENGTVDVEVSPSGNFIAAIVRHPNSDVLVLQNLKTGEVQALTKTGRGDAGPALEMTISKVVWKGDERIVFGVEVYPARNVAWERLGLIPNRKLGEHYYSIDRYGKGLVSLMEPAGKYGAGASAYYGSIGSELPHDPSHVLMLVERTLGPSLYKVNVYSGVGSLLVRGEKSVYGWWLDLEGNPVVQVEVGNGRLRFYRREKNNWKKFHTIRLGDLTENDKATEYDPLGPSDAEGKFYVLARPEGAQRRAIYLYDLINEKFGEPVVEHPQFDITSAVISRDGKSIRAWCYLAHVRICETNDKDTNANIKGIRKFFADSANVYFAGMSDDGEILILAIEGPSDPPSFYWYRKSTKKIEPIGLQQEAARNKRLPTAQVIEYEARDGFKVHGYLTRPPGAETATNLPLIVMPHGGPEARDHLMFSIEVQYYTSRGYAVFQPNFRGSDGFGRSYAESGYREWGRKMQDDITDGVRLLVERKAVDPQRMCIVGASYGGYAALAGAAFTPDLYQSAVSIAGISKLDELVNSGRKKYGSDSGRYEYFLKVIGDPVTDAARLAESSPVLNVDAIRIPILLIHGEYDGIVPYEQSKMMLKALTKSGRKAELITLEDEGHRYWTQANERRVLTSVAGFVCDKIGPGFGHEAGKCHDQ
jgi:dipeptidyl aminopeptidase/acylaminoacyl peptidase